MRAHEDELSRRFHGYHQIALATEDQEKTSFIIPKANYHYTVMPFGLKNVWATYQMMMTRMFRDKIGSTVEVYIDDMVVESQEREREREREREQIDLKGE